MLLRGKSFGPSTGQYEGYRLGAVTGIVAAAYAGFFLLLYWLMQPSVSANPGLAGYRPPPKTIVRYADSPWVPPEPSEPFPVRVAREPPEVAKSKVTEEPKKETKKQEARTAPRQARPAPARAQQNPFWGGGWGGGWGGFASSRSSSGSRPWF